MIAGIPDYIQARIRKLPPAGIRVVPGSTPVVAFGDVLKAKVATLGWNPSRREFLDPDGNELVGDRRRLETLTSLGETDLASASEDAVRRVFDACNNYFHCCPNRRWFNRLKPILKGAGACYYEGSACHLDLVQWATDPVWGKLRLHPSDKIKVIQEDLPFLRHQLSQQNFRLLLLNGGGIVKEYEKQFGVHLTELPLTDDLKLFTGHDIRGLKVIGWNINVQGTFGVSNKDVEIIGAAVGQFCRDCT